MVGDAGYRARAAAARWAEVAVREELERRGYGPFEVNSTAFDFEAWLDDEKRRAPDLLSTELGVEVKTGGGPDHLTVEAASFDNWERLEAGGLLIRVVHCLTTEIDSWRVDSPDGLWSRRVGGMKPPRPGHRTHWYLINGRGQSFDSVFPWFPTGTMF